MFFTLQTHYLVGIALIINNYNHSIISVLRILFSEHIFSSAQAFGSLSVAVGHPHPGPQHIDSPFLSIRAFLWDSHLLLPIRSVCSWAQFSCFPPRASPSCRFLRAGASWHPMWVSTEQLKPDTRQTEFLDPRPTAHFSLCLWQLSHCHFHPSSCKGRRPENHPLLFSLIFTTYIWSKGVFSSPYFQNIQNITSSLHFQKYRS